MTSVAEAADHRNNRRTDMSPATVADARDVFLTDGADAIDRDRTVSRKNS